MGLATGGLLVGAYLPGCKHTQWGAPGDFAPNAFVRVTPDDRVIFTLARVEMGQGTMTSETMLVAEELNLDPKEIEVEHAPNHEDYQNPDYLIQNTGGSNSTKSSYEPLRRAGATVREALLGAAASQWDVPKGELVLEGKTVRHSKSSREIRIGALAERARDFIDDDAEPKPRSEWRYLGKPQPRRDAQSKVDGTAIFGADPEPAGVEVAVVLHPPYGGALEIFDASEAKKMPGVRAIFEVPSGLAIVADRYPRARKAANAVKVQWTKSTFSTEQMFADYGALLDVDDGSSARSDGDVEDVFEENKQIIEAEYRFPYVAHATMEPMTTTVWVQEKRCDVWAPTQSTTLCANMASEVLDMPAKYIHVHQTLLGGGFGRKAYGDVVREAAEIAKHRPAPVRLIYSREDDLQRDLYRPASLHRLRAAIDGDTILAWQHRIVSQSSLFNAGGKDMMKEILPLGPEEMAVSVARSLVTDGSIVEGAANLPYAIENVEVSYHSVDTPIPTGVWRSVGHSFNAFIAETFIDELATMLGKDPFLYRRDSLAKFPRHLGVLNLAAEKAGWDQPLAEGHARGIAVHESFHSFAALVVELSLVDKKPRVHRVVAAVDCGLVMNPDGLRAQVESGVIYGLSSALTRHAITIKDGWVEQSNFHDFEVLRMHECPKIETHLVDSDAPPTGIGEVAVAPIAPAVANALARLTGKRYRELPLET
jgi:isoquinoline 1-oxidoreductase/isoquinoline 1-oxidoreductase beta subunit